MAEVGLVLHQHRPLVRDLASTAAEWLSSHGHRVRSDEEGGCRDGGFAAGLDLVLSLGGDGTMLRAVHIAAAHDVDVLGVNVGKLGYLTEIEPAGLVPSLERYFAGDYGVEERMLLSVGGVVGGAPLEPREHALNEMVLEKTAAGHTIHLAVALDGEHFTTYSADGLIVATPTGSTAYAFSARGPIVDPLQRALLLTPVSPHMLFDRTLVLGPQSEVVVTVTEHRPATLTVDGRNLGVLQEGDEIRCRASQHSARLVTFGPRRFHRILKSKFGLDDRLRSRERT